MTTIEKYDYPKRGINRYVSQYIRELPDLAGKVVLDIPCGDGRASHEFLRKGATVRDFDLFPGFLKLKGIKAEYADLADTLPLDDSSVDYVICQEGIEHVPNQLGVLEEFNRVLKKNGVLLITTPNYSHVRARLSHFFLESDYWKRMPPTEMDSIWFAKDNSEKLYFGHLFLLNIQRFQTILSIAGFQTDKRIKTDLGNTSLVLGAFLYPLFTIITFLSWILYRKKNTHISQAERDRILWERLKLNLSPKTLLCKHIFWVLHKETRETATRLRNMRKACQ